MSTNPPHQEPPSGQYAEARKEDITPVSPPPDPAADVLQAAQEAREQGHALGAAAAAAMGVQILKREEEERLAQSANKPSNPDGRAADALEEVTWTPEPGLLAKTFAWVILIVFGLGSVVLLSAFILSMIKG